MAAKKHSTHRPQHQPPDIFPLKENPPCDTSHQWHALKEFARSKPDDVLAGVEAANNSYNRAMALIELLKGRATCDTSNPPEISQSEIWGIMEILQTELGIIQDAALRTYHVWSNLRRLQTKEAN